jgi:hypothetical protein
MDVDFIMRLVFLQPRSLELFAAIRIIDDVMKQAIPTPTARLYKMPDGVDVMHEFEMSPHLNPTPTNPFVRVIPLKLVPVVNGEPWTHNCH